MSATEALAEYVTHSTLEAIPRDVRDEAKRAIFNYLGCALGGSVEPALDVAIKTLAPFSGNATASVLGRAERFDALHAALLNGIEHSDKQWKHIFALPVPRHSIYLAKFIVAQALILISTAVLAVLIVIVGVAATYVRTELANAGPVPFGWIAKYTLLVWIAGWFIIAIHTWISMRWSGFPIALGAGIAGTFFALFAASASIGKYYPWLLPMNLFLDGRFTAAIVLGAAGGIIGALLGCVEFVRRDVI